MKMNREAIADEVEHDDAEVLLLVCCVEIHKHCRAPGTMTLRSASSTSSGETKKPPRFPGRRHSWTQTHIWSQLYDQP